MSDSPGDQPNPVTSQQTPPPSGVFDSEAQKSDGEVRTFIDDKSEGLQAPADWPQDWREKLAGEDEKYLNKLKRYNSPQDYAKSYREMEKLISQQKRPLGENPTPEELAQYRKDNGIPETPEGYDLNFDNGLVIGEEDKAGVQEYLKAMHGLNASPQVVKEGVKAYLQIRDKYVAEMTQQETMHKKETIETLQRELGPEYPSFKNAVVSYLQNLPDGIGEAIMNGRDGSGRALLNTPAFAKWIGSLAREDNSTIAHFTGQTGVSVEERIQQIQKIIRDEPERYYKGAEGDKLQKEMAKLSEAKSKKKEKAA